MEESTPAADAAMVKKAWSLWAASPFFIRISETNALIAYNPKAAQSREKESCKNLTLHNSFMVFMPNNIGLRCILPA
jgi:hypothetical protein